MNNKNMIKHLKEHIKNSKPTKDKHGTVTQAIFIYDHILYALIRETSDFTKCSHNKERAMDIAKSIRLSLITLLKLDKKEQIENYYAYNKLKNCLGELDNVSIAQLLYSVEKQLAKYAI